MLLAGYPSFGGVVYVTAIVGGIHMSEIYIVGFDSTEHSRRAVEYATTCAKKSDAEICLVHIVEWSPYSFHTPEELAERRGRREQELDRANAVVQPMVDELSNAGVKVSSEIKHGNAADLLCKIAAEKNAAQIIVGRTGDSGFAQRLLGGLAHTLVQVAPVPVTIVP